MDALSNVLRALRLTGTVYFRAEFNAPWGMNMQGGQFANFHLVVDGECWVRNGPNAEPIALGPGELVLFPRGDAHALLESPDRRADPVESVFATAREESGTKVFGGEGNTTTTLICGHFEYDRNSPHPLFEHLPDMLYVPHTDASSDWITTATQLTELEATAGRQGGSAIVDRLAEVLLIQILRAYLEQMEEPSGFIAALNHPGLGRALMEIHRAPAVGWTVERAAKVAGMSRSVFAERFRAEVGLTPMQYVMQWRMLRAKELLHTSEGSLSEIASEIGYESEFAFAKAFKKQFGQPPGAFRRSA